MTRKLIDAYTAETTWLLLSLIAIELFVLIVVEAVRA